MVSHKWFCGCAAWYGVEHRGLNLHEVSFQHMTAQRSDGFTTGDKGCAGIGANDQVNVALAVLGL